MIEFKLKLFTLRGIRLVFNEKDKFPVGWQLGFFGKLYRGVGILEKTDKVRRIAMFGMNLIKWITWIEFLYIGTTKIEPKLKAYAPDDERIIRNHVAGDIKDQVRKQQ